MARFLVLALFALAMAVVATAVAAWVAGARWRVTSREYRRRLHRAGARHPAAARAGEPPAPPAYDPAELRGLPDPVARYLRAVLRPGQPIHARARLAQRGSFRIHPGPRGWRVFRAAQVFSARPPGFVWDARITLFPGVDVYVRDALIEGRGSMRAAVAGLVTLVDAVPSGALDAGALHRYLAEAVWNPTALLPSQGVRWQGLDDRTAVAHLAAGAAEVALEFRFGPHDLVESVFTDARFRDVDGRPVPTPWGGRFSRYEEFQGMRIPREGEVAWHLKEGEQAYWRGLIEDAEYESAAALTAEEPLAPGAHP